MLLLQPQSPDLPPVQGPPPAAPAHGPPTGPDYGLHGTTGAAAQAGATAGL